MHASKLASNNSIRRQIPNTNISPREKECLHKRSQRSRWSPEMRLKVQQYDRDRKRQKQAEPSTQKKTPTEAERKNKLNKVVECEIDGGETQQNCFKLEKTVSVLQLKAFKLQNRIEDHKKLVDRIKDTYGSLNKAAKALKMHYCTLWNLCQTPTKNVSNKRSECMKEKMETLSQFYSQKSVSSNVPTARQAKKQFLTSTYEEAHSKYVDWCKTNENVPVPFGTFYRLKPENVYSVGKIPENHCCCRLCQNFHLDKVALNEAKIKGIGHTTSEIILGSLCPVTDTDGGVVPDYGYYDCISRNCKKCGKKKTFSTIYKKKVIHANPEIKNDQKLVKWKRWEMTVRQSKEGKDIKRLDKFTKETTRLEFLDYFIKDLQEMSLHLFNWKWHDTQFDYIKSTLKLGMLLQVLDCAQNYMNKYQDEPKECHWDHAQTVLHPIINHRICPDDGKMIVEEHIIVSDDLIHNKCEQGRRAYRLIMNVS